MTGSISDFRPDIDSDPDIDIYEWREPLRRWSEAPWWRRWWHRLRMRGSMPYFVFMVVNEAEVLRQDLEHERKRCRRLEDGLGDLVGRFQGLTAMTGTLVTAEHQERFVATMHDAIDYANKVTGAGSFGWAKPQASTAAHPLVCVECGRTSKEQGARFCQLGAGVHCFRCIGAEEDGSDFPLWKPGETPGETP